MALAMSSFVFHQSPQEVIELVCVGVGTLSPMLGEWRELLFLGTFSSFALFWKA